MSTTVTYKGSTLTTVDNQTRTLKTAGKYMEGDVVLTDVSSDEFIITIVENETTEMWEPNKTFAEILEAYNAGKNLITIPESSYFFADGEYVAKAQRFYYNVYLPDDDEYGQCIYTFNYIRTSSATTLVKESHYYLPNGTKTITANGTGINVIGYETVDVNVSGGGSSPTLQTKTVTYTPTESQQTATVTADSGYDGLSQVGITVNAISSTYVGTGITRRSSSDLTASGATVTVPSGYYENEASKSVTVMTLPTSAASSATSGYTSKATIGRSTAAQYINIPPGYNGAGAYYVISATPNGSVTAPSSISGTTATISTGSGTLTLTKTVSVTPNVTTAGYISSGTAGNSSVSLTANVTINPTPTASGATVTIPAGYYSSQTTKSVTSGSATAPSTISGTAASVSTGTNTLTLTKTVSVTPTVSAGYVSAGTAGNASVSLTASVTTKAAATITPTTTNQTIAAGTYLTGTQTIAGDADLVGSNILSTANIFGVQGTVDFIDVYIRSAAPTSSVGNDGDIYIQE